VVFCHGAGSNAATWWQQIPSFAQRFTCITFDHRCFGRSTADLDVFIPEMFSSDLLAILNVEQIDQVALVCQSMGGMAGLRFALEHPARVSAFVPCDTPLAINHAAVLSSVKNYLRRSEVSTLEER